MNAQRTDVPYCKTCMSWDEYSWVCCNGASPYCADFTEPGGGCQYWKLKEQKMEIERAAEILADESMIIGRGDRKQLNEACRLGSEAMGKLMKKSPFPDGDTSIYACAYCGCGEYLFNEDGRHNRCCGNCGQAIDWSGDFDDGGDELEDYLREDGEDEK